MVIDDQAEVISFLSRAESFGGHVVRVDRVETHASVIFLTENRAYKLKRAVRFPYLDYSTIEDRKRFCEAEVEINRRTAPMVYRRAVAVTRNGGGGLVIDGGGPAVDWLVEMERFDQSTLFDRLCQRGRLDRFAMEDLADAVARFHAEAEVHTDTGGRGAIADLIENNLASFAEAAGGVLDAATVAHLTEACRRALDGCGDLLDARRLAGSVRRCHGDLHLRNIFLYEGQATLFDAIEFDDALPVIDVLYDLAFLIMDLDHRAQRGLASILFNRYLDVTGDGEGLAAFPLFLALRSAIRGHVSAAAADSQSDDDEATSVRVEARQYVDRAIDYLHGVPARVVAIGGLSGSGKSRLARELAPRVGAAPGARVVRTDCTRKRIAGVPLGARLGPGGYVPEMTRRTYAAVFDECRQVLAAGHSVISDAVFAEPHERQAIADVAHAAGVPFQGLWLHASADAMQERVSRRQRNVSDATAAVVRLQMEYDTGEIEWHRLDTEGPRDAVLDRACAILDV